MAKMMTRTVVLLAMALSAVTLPSIAQEEAKPLEIASVSGVVSGVGDPALNRAINLIMETQKARQLKQHRQNIQPTPQDTVVRGHKDINHTLILGGAESLPM